MKKEFESADPVRADWTGTTRIAAPARPDYAPRLRIAAVDDDPSQLDLIRRVVESLGHSFVGVERGDDLLRKVARESFDLLVVDWQLPDVSGLDVVRRVRERLDTWVPVIIVTNRGDERDVVQGLGAGADDYMIKPMRVREAAARLSALLRRHHPQQGRQVQHYGDYCFDLGSRTASYRGVPIELKQKEFELALCLFSHPGRLLSRDYLRALVWGTIGDVMSRTLDTHVSSLRAKLGLRPERGYRLASVYGQGYRLDALCEVGEDTGPEPRSGESGR